MSTLLGVALSLLLSRGPTNGFDPTSMYVLRQGSQFVVDGARSTEFAHWLAADPERRVPAVRYFVACAFEEVVVSNSGKYSWTGALGLAPSLTAALGRLAPSPTPGGAPPDPTKPGYQGPDPNSPGLVTSVQLVPTPDDGRWVSACLMALSNMSARHQYVLLRGNPPAWKAGPSEAELWTMGYPEGVFFADLHNFNVVSQGQDDVARAHPAPPTKADLEKSYTLSLDLPDGYPGVPTAHWAPPNASNGRTLDFNAVTPDTVEPIGPYRVAEKLGTYLKHRKDFEREGVQHDPFYEFDLVCVGPGPAAVHPQGAQETPRRVVSCTAGGAERLRPLFVHAPRVVGLASAARKAEPLLTIQALDTGGVALTESQRSKCDAGVSCTGPFHLTATGEPPVAPATQAARTLVRLGPKQSVTVVLRRDAMKQVDPLDPRTERFTAIIRYRSKAEAAERIEVSDLGGGLRVVEPRWPATAADSPPDWRWMQVYPVYAVRDPRFSGGRLALMSRVSGPELGASDLDLDIAGFVSGPPWCLPEGAERFAGVCPDREEVVPLLRRAGAPATPR